MGLLANYMARRLDGKVAVITGSSRGIGRAIALEFAREGAKVCINYIKSEDRARQVVDEINSLGGEALMIRADVSKLDDVRHLVKGVIDRFGRIDILVNNAAIMLRGDFLETEDDEFYRILDKMWEVNVKGVVYCCKEVAKHMVRNRYGKIINIASNAGIGTAFPGTTPYAMTKAAIIILTRRLAFELGPYGINVNAIAPGMVLTDMATPEGVELAKKRSILGRVGNPEDIARLAVFLASDESSYITGQVIVADGGRIDYLTHSL
ncbi:MAG: 3-oxoacyl-ACP reductase FabG [Thaumarchaeota archaeon]|jgi:3-oxoacyl-[acyl-carrier protein] reductase|nr:3-oxoacyl-ACP reductase FabG [Candidatus Wolframiiraptor allenii]